MIVKFKPVILGGFQDISVQFWWTAPLLPHR